MLTVAYVLRCQADIASKSPAIRLKLLQYIGQLPGFYKFRNAETWIENKEQHATLEAVFVGDELSRDAQINIAYFTTNKRSMFHEATRHECNITIEERFDCSVIAFKHTPSASNFARLEAAMLALQTARYPDSTPR